MSQVRTDNEGNPLTADGRPLAVALYAPRTPDALLCCAVVAVRLYCADVHAPDRLSRLGFRHRAVSGAQARGGPGVRVRGVWVVSRHRWDRSPVLRAEVALLCAELNPGPPGDRTGQRAIEAAQAHLAEVKAHFEGLKAKG